MGTSVSRAILAHLRNIFAVLMAALLVFTLVPPAALAADGEGADAAAPSEGSHAEASGAEEGEGASAADAAAQPSAVPSATIAASALIGKPTAFVSADVALVDDAEPVVGSFTVDGLTFSISDDGATLVAVAPGAFPAERPSGPSEVPSMVSYGDVAYDVVAIGPYAFYLSGATEVELPASVASVDDRAFRSSDVERVEVAEGNTSYASFDGCLYDSQLISLLLIPEGRAGAILLPKTAEVVEAGKFSHCSLVDAISVEEGGAAFASWEGLLYDADGTTLLRVPAGATDVTIREGCMTTAAGAMEGCAKLERISAPSTVTSISPDVFASVPTVSLPALSALGDDPVVGSEGQAAGSDETEEGEGALGSEVPTSPRPPSPSSTEAAPQLTAMVALLAIDEATPMVQPSSVTIVLPENAPIAIWRSVGFTVSSLSEEATVETAATFAACTATVHAMEHRVHVRHTRNNATWDFISEFEIEPWTTFSQSVEGWYSADAGRLTLQTADLLWGAESGTPGWSIIGWSKSVGGSQIPTMDWHTESAALYPTWRAHTYTISFNANGGAGSVPSAISATYDQPYTVAAPSLTRAGYAFDGWATSAGGAKAYEKVGPFKNLTAIDGGSVPLYAHWAPNAYTVAFDTRGGEGTDAVAAEYDKPLTLPSTSRAGYRFMGWDTQADGKGVRYQAGEEVSNLTDEANGTVTLYAQWALAYDLTLPICDPADITFRVDATTGNVDAVGATANADGFHHDGAVTSSMAVPVALSEVSLEALADNSGKLGLSSIFSGDDPASKVKLTVGSGNSSTTAVAFGDTAALSGLVVPSVSDGGRLPVSYGLELAEGVGPGDIVDKGDEAAVPVGRVSYTVDVVGGIASEHEMFILDSGASGRAVSLEEIKADANALALLAAQGQDALESSSLYQRYYGYLTNPDASPTYMKVYDQPDGGWSLHRLQVLGICQDVLSTPCDVDGVTVTKAGLTFGWKDYYVTREISPEDSKANVDNGWAYPQPLRTWLTSNATDGFYSNLPDSLKNAETGIASVHKEQQLANGSTYAFLQHSIETVFIPSLYEMIGTASPAYNPSEGLLMSSGRHYEPFQYSAFELRGYTGFKRNIWTRSGSTAWTLGYCFVSMTGKWDANLAWVTSYGVLPCFAL